MTVSVLGGGGHATVVVATLQAAGVTVAGLYDDDPATQGRHVLGVPVVGPVEAAEGLAVIGIGDNAVRQRVAAAMEGRVSWATAVHPSAVVHPSVQVSPGAVVFAGAVVQPDAVLGAHVIVNTSASVDHDSRVGAFAHIAPGARLAGGVVVEKGAFLGIASCVIPGQTVGAWATVGAGAVVLRAVADGQTVVGVPARPVE